ncbi:MAG: 5-formyltetrahydrofolate cyclo-ligase [bacterium]
MSIAPNTYPSSEKENFSSPIFQMKNKVGKSLLRKRILALRRSQSPQAIERKSDEIKRKLLGIRQFSEAGTILFYLALGDEVQTEKMIEESLKLGKRVAVPLINSRHDQILISKLKDPERELEPGTLGIFQPKKNFYRPLKIEELELVIVPGVALDKRGNRLGFGKGFYDRFLKKTPDRIKSIALAFELQLVDDIPTQSHDARVDYIITEKRIIDCKNSDQ